MRPWYTQGVVGSIYTRVYWAYLPWCVPGIPTMVRTGHTHHGVYQAYLPGCGIPPCTSGCGIPPCTSGCCPSLVPPGVVRPWYLRVYENVAVFIHLGSPF